MFCRSSIARQTAICTKVESKNFYSFDLLCRSRVTSDVIQLRYILIKVNAMSIYQLLFTTYNHFIYVLRHCGESLGDFYVEAYTVNSNYGF